MKDLAVLKNVAWILLLLGGINLGILGLIDIDLIIAVFGRMLGRLFFIIIGISAGYLIYLRFKKTPV